MTGKAKAVMCTEVLTMLSVLLYAEHVILTKSFRDYDELEERYRSSLFYKGIKTEKG